MKKLTLIWLACITSLHAVVVVEGNDPNPPRGFLTAVNAQAYDQSRGTFFVGLTAGTSITEAQSRYTISKAERPTFTTTPRFVPVLFTNSLLLNQTIEFLETSAQIAPTAQLLIAVQQGNAQFEATTVFALTTTGANETQTPELNDANGATTAGIMNIAASSCHVFAAVRANGTVDGFGTIGSGIAVMGINPRANPLLTVLNANTGMAGNRAFPLDETSVVLTGGTSDVQFTSTGVALKWDEPLQRLYIGTRIQTGDDAGDIGKSVVAARIACNALMLDPIAPNGAITGSPVDEIVVTQGESINLAAKNICVMHTTTGPDYLIVNGGTGTADEVCNRIRALPLVYDPAAPSINGTLANKNAPLTNFKFTIPATAPGELSLEDDDAARVGAGNLPIQPNTPISDIQVVDDAVYVSVGAMQILSPISEAQDTGIFYSQAIFDSDGRIARWTPWTKRVTPFNAFPTISLPNCAMHNGTIRFFEVDAKTGNVWVVENCSGRVVGITNWGAGTAANSLPTTVQNSLQCDGSYSVLDLDQATRGFLNATTSRYALFGGVNKVAFARISQAVDISNPESPQEVIQDFSLLENFRLTVLPDAGCIQALEYSRTSTALGDEPNINYFFAGSDAGLFVFADGQGNGFNATQLSTLDESPFGNSWHKIESIQGSVIDIKTSGAGDRLYVIVSGPTSGAPLASRLLSIPFAPNIATMFDPSNIRTIAQTGQNIFRMALQFYGIQIIATGGMGNEAAKEQLILATSQGLFRSNATQLAGNAGVPVATNEISAAWQAIPGTSKNPYFGIAGMDTPVRQTVWPFNLEDEHGCFTFNRASINQLSGNGNASGTMAIFNLENPFIPENFNTNSSAESLQTLNPFIYFFSDGGRRFFISKRPQDPATQNRLTVLPYNATGWNVTQETTLLTGSLRKAGRFFWVRPIGMSGFVMAGTGTGVTALE